MPNQHHDIVRGVLLDALMRKATADHYPSSTMLDQIESLLTDDDFGSYAEMLVDHIDGDLYPSIPVIERVLRLTA